MTFRPALAFGACALALAVAGGTAAKRSASPAPAAPTLRLASGWVVIKRGPAEPDVPASMVVAVTVHDIAAARPLALFTSLKHLSAHGILIWAEALGRERPGFRPLTWPPLLSTFRVDHGWEGQPAPNIQQRLAFGSVQGWDLDVRVFFGTQHPDAKLRQEAQVELRRLFLPKH